MDTLFSIQVIPTCRLWRPWLHLAQNDQRILHTVAAILTCGMFIDCSEAMAADATPLALAYEVFKQMG